ncbi:MAG: 50S ribosomal protein L15 [Spirochaetales bacterium]|nr:50S ribosomal protein L15 [Spirochaetales bacterium]
MENMFILRAPQGANKKKTIIGRGRSSGTGGTSGRGNKGQKSRSGGGVRLGFEGGQTPLFRRLPSRGFSNAYFKVDYTVINLSDLERVYSSGETVDYNTLVAKGLVKKSETLVKLLATGSLTKKLTVSVDKVSEAAKSAVEKAGGTVTAVQNS